MEIIIKVVKGDVTTIPLGKNYQLKGLGNNVSLIFDDDAVDEFFNDVVKIRRQRAEVQQP